MFWGGGFNQPQAQAANPLGGMTAPLMDFARLQQEMLNNQRLQFQQNAYTRLGELTSAVPNLDPNNFRSKQFRTND
jgi:hypothetical protein